MADRLQMIFVPLSRPRASEARATGGTDEELAAFAATPRMIAAHGYRPDEDEDADYAAQLYASIAGLIGAGEPAGADRPEDSDSRLVISAEVPAGRIRESDRDPEHGAVVVQGLKWSEVTAVFVDEPAAAPAVRAAREAISGSDDHRLTTLLDLPAVMTLTDDHDLLWHTPDEDW
jgi:hypothetical protein